jgi:hypothetical protein
MKSNAFNSFFALCALCAAGLTAATASAEVLVYEGFSSSDYPSTGNLNNRKAANDAIGLDTSAGWNTGTAVFTAQDSGLSLPSSWTGVASNVHGTKDRRAVLTYNQAFSSSKNQRVQQRRLNCSSWPTSGSLYFRFLMRVPSGLLTTSYLCGNGNYCLSGLGCSAFAGSTPSGLVDGVYMGVRNNNGTLKACAYVSSGGTVQSADLFTIDTSKTLDCAFAAKIDVGANGYETVSVYAAPFDEWDDGFLWTASFSVSLTTFQYLQMLGQYTTNNQWLTFDEFIVTTDESEAYYKATDVPFIGDVSLSRTGAAAYALSAEEALNEADLSWIADDGATAVTNGTQTVAGGGTASWTVSGLAADKTYMISVVAENAADTREKEAGTIYTGELTLGATTSASESTLTPGTVAVSRASADSFPLTVNYTITGSAGSEGVTWEAPAAVTIPANETTGYLLVKPLVDLSVHVDVEATVTLAAGNYEIPSADSATVTIVNDDASFTLTITNAFDNPDGGYLRSSTGFAITNTTNRMIAFAALGSGETGLREFITQPANNVETSYVSRDWLLYSAAQTKPSASSTQQAINVATTTLTSGINAKKTSYTYAGSWYIPTSGTYSFRMSMLGVGVFSLDGRLVLKQNASSTAVTTNGVALSAGWHNFCVSFLAAASSNKLGPASGETLGFSFSDSNAELTKAEPGKAFDAENCQFDTAFNAVLLPYLCANGANLIIDCKNVVGDLRIAGVLVSRNNGTFTVVNLPSGRTLEIGRPLRAYTYGYYEFQNLNDFGFVDWSKTTIPSGVNVRFEGAMAINNTWKTHGPGATSVTNYALGNHALLVTEVAGFFGELGAEFPYPAGLTYLHIVNPQVLGQTAKIIVPAGGGLGIGGKMIAQSTSANYPSLSNAEGYVFQNDIELGADASVNGTATWNGAHVLAGNITGDGGLRVTGYTHRLKMTGQVVGRDANAGQRGCRLNFYPKAGSGPSVLTGTVSLSGERDVNYCGGSFFYCPEIPGEHPFSIGTVDAYDADWVEGRTYAGRRGATLSTCSNSTINVTTLKGAGVHLRAAIPPDGGVWNASNDIENFGPGNFVFGRINGSNPMQIFVSSNINITVTNIVKAAAFHYEVMSNGVNAAVLDIENSEAAGVAGSTITATDIAMLPGRIKGFTGDITLTDNTEGRTYDVVYDFDRGVAIGGCDGSGNLAAAPSTGTINLSFTGTPRKGNFGVVKFDSVADGVSLAGWTIDAPDTYAKYRISISKGATGITFGTHTPLMIIVR